MTEKEAFLSPIDDKTDEGAILPTIEKLLGAHGASFDSLTKVAVVTGPGGFMSLRVGVSLANALAWGRKIPIAGIHLSDLWHARALDAQLWVHSTKKNALFVRGFGSFEKEWPEASLHSLEEFKKTIGDRKRTFVGELIDEHRSPLLSLQVLQHVRSLEEVLPTLLQDAMFEKKPVMPWYGRGH